MQVTVYDRVPETADVSTRQVLRYAERTGFVDGLDGWAAKAVWKENVERCPLVDIINGIATAEGRQPSAVLADIAKEPV